MPCQDDPAGSGATRCVATLRARWPRRTMRAPDRALSPATTTSRSRTICAAVLGSIGEAVYDWDIASDRIAWSGQAASVLGTRRCRADRVRPRLRAPRSPRRRRLALRHRDAHAGSRRRPRRRLPDPLRRHAARRTPVCVEDTGRWFAGTDGRPAKVHGVVRRAARRRPPPARRRPIRTRTGSTAR